MVLFYHIFNLKTNEIVENTDIDLTQLFRFQAKIPVF